VKKLLKFSILLICVFVASNLKLDAANGEQEKDPSEKCSVCLVSLYYKTNTDENLVDAQGQVIPIDRKGNLVNESDKSRLVPLADSQIKTLDCKHEFHENCFQGWLTSDSPAASTCPLCRQPHGIRIPGQQQTVPQPIISQNVRIRVWNNTKIDCNILTPDGFDEIKTYLQESPSVVNLRLILNDNTIQIPGNFFVGLNHLRRLDLFNNQLTSLPESIGNLRELRKLELRFNQLTVLPPEIGNLRSLKELDLQNNQLTSLPAEIGNLRELRKLDLFRNRLTSLPAEIGNLRELRKLDLFRNRLTSLPPEIGNIRELRELELRFNQLTVLPAGIGQLTSLKWLNLQNNQLTSLPVVIGQLTSLVSLELNSNELTELPTSIGELSSLQILGLGNNDIIHWPTTILQPLLDKRSPTRIFGQGSQRPLPLMQRLRNWWSRITEAAPNSDE
jgi:Leucine-rich repeat (LRR) protein